MIVEGLGTNQEKRIETLVMAVKEKQGETKGFGNVKEESIRRILSPSIAGDMLNLLTGRVGYVSLIDKVEFMDPVQYRVRLNCTTTVMLIILLILY